MSVRNLPAPLAGPGQVVIGTVASLISAGTERYVVDLAQKSLVGKARARPDHVRRVLEKVRAEGLLATMGQVRAKLDEPMPLGYSSAGLVLECGRGVQEFKPGDRVAAAAPHAGVVSVGRNLCARIPEAVLFEQAAYTSVAAIGLEGVRLGRVSLGDSVLVVGLGLIGQMCVCMLKAAGCRVFGTDLHPTRLSLAKSLGADEVGLGSPLEAVRAFSRGHGVDAAIITAATSSNEPIEFSAASCRARGRIVLVGVVGLALPRAPFFEKELEFTVSSSLGPGRNDPSYEEKGIDYPVGHARWTAQRNMEAVLDLMDAGKLPVDRLTTHRFPVEEAEKAYALVTAGREPHLGIVLEYGESARSPARRVDFDARPQGSHSGVSLIGAGNFSRLILLPALERVEGLEWRGICTARGMGSEHVGRRRGFAFATTEADDIWNDEATGTVFVVTRHDQHAAQVMAALRAGKNVFVEKPLCIHEEELEELTSLVESLGTRCPVLSVGFNRRFAPAIARIREFFDGVEPLSISYRFAPGALPSSHWTQDEEVGGGRIVGEACHAIDTCTAIAGSEPIRVYAESVGKTGGLQTTDDRVVITIRHANGSVSAISYQAGGDRGGPKERIEVLGGGKTLTMEGWDEIIAYSGGRQRRLSGQKDKGHAAEVVEFLRVCREGGAWPIPWREIRAVAAATLGAVRSLREGVPIDVG